MPTPGEVIAKGPKALGGLTGIDKVNAIFWNFVHYFRSARGWQYQTTTASGQDILDGKSNSRAYCENMAIAFRLLVRELVGRDVASDGPYTMKAIMTPHLSSVLPGLEYNVRFPHNTCAKQQQYLFNAKHVYCKIASRYYDPLFGVSGPREHFHIDCSAFHTVSRDLHTDLTGTLADAYIPQAQPDVIYRAIPSAGAKPDFVCLTPANLGKRAMAALIKFYKRIRLGQWAKKYGKARATSPFVI